MKELIIKLNNGETWGLPCDIVAISRANYYANKVSSEERDRVFREEYVYTYTDNLELEDWFENNMDFAEVKHRCRLLQKSNTFVSEIVSVEVKEN